MKSFVWCTYRGWSFDVLAGLLDHPEMKCSAILTTSDFIGDLSLFANRGIKIFRLPPKSALKEGSEFRDFLIKEKPDCSFFYGWSWIIPKDFHEAFFSVTFHPGKLPNDKGGSPLQNQIRNGETWSYGNIIAIAEKLDGGDIYAQEKFSLEGDISDVWARMTATGIFATRRFLSEVAQNKLNGQKQVGDGTLYERVKPGSEELLPQTHTAMQAYNIVRAHNETDPNTYVKRAFLRLGEYRLICMRSSLTQPRGDILEFISLLKEGQDALYKACHQVNNEEKSFKLVFSDGKPLFITQSRLSL